LWALARIDYQSRALCGGLHTNNWGSTIRWKCALTKSKWWYIKMTSEPVIDHRNISKIKGDNFTSAYPHSQIAFSIIILVAYLYKEFTRVSLDIDITKILQILFFTHSSQNSTAQNGCTGWSGSMLVANALRWFCHDTTHLLIDGQNIY
jgi:hypothetical protein